jgi:hypothetical protein
LSVLKQKPRVFTKHELSQPRDQQAFLASINKWTIDEPVGMECLLGQEESSWKKTLYEEQPEIAVADSVVISEED